MATVQEYLSELSQDLQDFPQQAPDPRTVGKLLMDPYIALGIGLAYVVITKLGQALMSGRKPFDLKAFRIVHNGAMCALSTYMFYGILKNILKLGWFQEIDRTEAGDDLAFFLHLFYVSKSVEMLDTAIMVLRGKNNQVSFLHVYHHCTVHWIWWLNVRMYPGGEASEAALANSWVHMWMYGYYFLSTLGFSPFWKKALTQMQLLQFCFMITEGLYLTIFGARGFRPLGTINGIYALTLLFLFLKFFKKTYKGPKDGAKKDEKKKKGDSGKKVTTPKKRSKKEL